MARQSTDERIHAVRILLTTLNDYLPVPSTSSGLISQSSLPGPAPGKRVPCGYCRRTGKVSTRAGRRHCPVCTGSGWRRRRGPSNPSHPRYEEPWDEYTAQPVTEQTSQRVSSMSARELDVQLEILARMAAVRAGVVDHERYGWERERILHDRKGSYSELRRALRSLEQRWPAGHLELRRRYFLGVTVRLSAFEQLLADAGEEWLARTMRGPIRVPPWLAEQSAKRKARSVKELAAEGMTAGEIARELRVPKGTVQRQLRATSLSDRVATVPPAFAPGESA